MLHLLLADNDWDRLIIRRYLNTNKYNTIIMNNKEILEPIEEKDISLSKKIITWIIVFSITIMLLLMIVFQPRFFNFIN